MEEGSDEEVDDDKNDDKFYDYYYGNCLGEENARQIFNETFRA